VNISGFTVMQHTTAGACKQLNNRQLRWHCTCVNAPTKSLHDYDKTTTS